MTNYKLVPLGPTPEMVRAAEDAHMPFGDMELAIRMAILEAPEVEQEPVAWLWGSSNCTTDREMAEGFEQRTPGSTTPLYLHPQPAPDVSA